jgi:branched-chain amino acid transport system permease protein
MLGESPISVFMVTVGLGSVLDRPCRVCLGQLTRSTLPNFLPSKPFFIRQRLRLAERLRSASRSLPSAIAHVLVSFRYWRGGVALRATATDQGAAYSCGINVPAVFSVVVDRCRHGGGWLGILIGSIGGVSPTMGVFGLSVLVVCHRWRPRFNRRGA